MGVRLVRALSGGWLLKCIQLFSFTAARNLVFLSRLNHEMTRAVYELVNIKIHRLDSSPLRGSRLPKLFPPRPAEAPRRIAYGLLRPMAEAVVFAMQVSDVLSRTEQPSSPLSTRRPRELVADKFGSAKIGEFD
jgi:hypothetical protein